MTNRTHFPHRGFGSWRRANDAPATTVAEPIERLDPIVRDELAIAMRDEVNVLRNASRDAISDTRALELVPLSVTDIAGTTPERPEDSVLLDATTPDGPMRMNVLHGAHEQFAKKTQIPWKYYERMLHSEPELLADNVNTWFQAEPGNRLVRMLAPLT